MSAISRCGCGIDVHAHVVPASFPRYMGAAAPTGWPSMEDANPCHKHVMMDGRVYRTASDRCWDVGKRISDMEQMGLGVPTLLHPISRFGETQIMLGTDYPFAFHDRTPVARAASAVSEATRNLVTSGNAKSFLGLGEHVPQ